MKQSLPPGPKAPAIVQTLNWQARPIAFIERASRTYGKRWTLNLLATPPFVMHSDPAAIKEIFTAPPDVLHPGEGAKILEPIVGKYSVILLDGGSHLSQRKLMLPAFHGEKMQALTALMSEVAEREVVSWPKGEPVVTHERFQALTLEIILRAVFGLDPGARLDTMRDRLVFMATEATKPWSLLPALQNDRSKRWRQYVAVRDEVDGMIFDLVDERRAKNEDRDDILSMLLDAQHEDGTPMSKEELRDELMTLLVAGHETTASTLAWAFERLVHEPHVVRRLQEEIDGGEDEAYLTATIQETLRARPVLPNAAPRLVKKPIEVAGWKYEPGVCLVVNSYLVQHDPDIYPDPYTFRPERFVEKGPGTYTWTPFGGGRRRCLGASFALVEMKVVLKAILERYDVTAATPVREGSRRRAITIAPRSGGRTIFVDRVPAAKPEALAA